ncbi:unnamed protein product [Calypogeia fissa]
MKMSTQAAALCLLFALGFAQFTEAARLGPFQPAPLGLLARRFLFLVDNPSVILDYHNGPVLTGTNGVIPIYLIWYGNFNETDKAAVRNFLASFNDDTGTVTDVARWWNVTGGFKDSAGGAVAGAVQLAGEINDTACSRGTSINNTDMEALMLNSLNTFPSNPEAIYFVLTASDVTMPDFCSNSCASHFATSPVTTPGGLQLPYAWVGNPKDQCPGMCAWPFAQPSYMPANANLPLPPNGDIGADGMVIQMAYMLAGTATNPFDNAFYQGDASIPLEAGTACSGFGVGAYPGYPGQLKKDVITGAEYNAEGIDGSRFLLPTLWDPTTRTCLPLALTP